MSFNDYLASEITPQDTLLQKLNKIIKWLKDEKHIYIHVIQFSGINRTIEVKLLSTEPELSSEYLNHLTLEHHSKEEIDSFLDKITDNINFSTNGTYMYIDYLTKSERADHTFDFYIGRIIDGKVSLAGETPLIASVVRTELLL